MVGTGPRLEYSYYYITLIIGNPFIKGVVLDQQQVKEVRVEHYYI